MAMAAVGPYTSGAQMVAASNTAGTMMRHNRNESSADSLVAMLAPHVGLQGGSGGLEDAVRVQGGVTGQKRAFYATFKEGATVEDGPELEAELDGGEDCFGGASQLEKKRRLTFDQVRSLEKNFEMENKLEPERKMQLAKELGLRPRQVAVWFQNRRARWKTKQLERDYEALAQDYKRLKADYDQVLGEKNNLRTELQRLSSEVAPDGVNHDGNLSPQPGSQSANSAPDVVHRARSSPTVDVSLASGKENNGENSSGSSNSSDLLDAESPRTTDSSSLSPSSDRNDGSPFLDSSFPPKCSFMVPDVHDDAAAVAVKLEDPTSATTAVFPDDNSCNYLLQLDDQSGVLPWWDWP